MKKNILLCVINTIGIALAVLLLTGCEKWLDVRPSNQFDESEQFKSEQGYIDVLIGAYQGMTRESTYGAELSFRFVDVLAQLYENKSADGYYGLTARYDYTAQNVKQHSPKTVIDEMWKDQYNIISQLNYLLRRLDTRPAEVSERVFDILKGEALALRAYLHFDLLRLFAPAYSTQTAEERAIPYNKAFSVSPAGVLSLNAVVKEIEQDLVASIELQEGYQFIDQIRYNLNSTSNELFLMYRQNRMNYWAAKALLARLYLYIGDKGQARKYADEVIDSKRFTLFPAAGRNFDERDSLSNISFTHEHIFSLYHSGLRDVADNFFKTSAQEAENSDLFSTQSVLNGIYEPTSPGHSEDIRGLAGSPNRWSVHNSNVVYSKKYYSDRSSNVNQRMIPLIRLPEMYYIAAESSSSIAEGLEYLNEVRTARLLPELTAEQATDIATFQNELFKEYRKEYYAEGQLWHFFKRLHYSHIPNSVSNVSMDREYTLPIPDIELEFNPNF